MTNLWILLKESNDKNKDIILLSNDDNYFTSGRWTFASGPICRFVDHLPTVARYGHADWDQSQVIFHCLAQIVVTLAGVKPLRNIILYTPHGQTISNLSVFIQQTALF